MAAYLRDSYDQFTVLEIRSFLSLILGQYLDSWSVENGVGKENSISCTTLHIFVLWSVSIVLSIYTWDGEELTTLMLDPVELEQIIYGIVVIGNDTLLSTIGHLHNGLQTVRLRLDQIIYS